VFLIVTFHFVYNICLCAEGFLEVVCSKFFLYLLHNKDKREEVCFCA
jgi:hypothetical protein